MMHRKEHNILIMWWKIYFWTFTIVEIIGFTGITTNSLQRYDFFEILAGIVTIPLLFLAMYSYAYKKSILGKKFWYYYFWVTVLIFGLMMIYSLTQENNLIQAFQKGYDQFGYIFIVAIAFLEIFSVVIPYYMVYKLGHTKG